MNWYLIQTKPNAHMIASQHLKQQNFEVFLPLMLKTIKKGGKFVNKTGPVFPNYLFMGSPISHVPWKSINATRGVYKAVTLDGQYRTVDPNIINGLRLRCNSNGILQMEDQITSGDLVKINSGPFSKFICQVEGIAESKRVWVLIEILQQKTKAKIPINDLIKIN